MFEYCGSAIRALSIEERMTVCNMSIEAGARAGMVAPDDTTSQLRLRPPVRPQGSRLGCLACPLEATADRRWRCLRQRNLA